MMTTAKKTDQDEAISQTIQGRWDLTLHYPERSGAAWLEVRKSGHRTLVGQFVSTGGSARPISCVDVSEGKFSFSIPPQWERGDDDLALQGVLDGDGITGTISMPDGNAVEFSARRAPSLRRSKPPVWGEPLTLFNGHDLSGWNVVGGENHWEAKDGILFNTKSCGNIATDRLFEDFKLHVEFRLPPDGNSGVYLRGRYEVQVLDNPIVEPQVDLIGAIYGFIAPNQIVTHGADAWNAFDITLIGRMVTVAVNGVTVICEQAIPGITGGALDSYEGSPGPLLLQGDHTSIEYRNIILTPAV